MDKGEVIAILVAAVFATAVLTTVAVQYVAVTVPQRAACEAAGNVWVGKCVGAPR